MKHNKLTCENLMEARDYIYRHYLKYAPYGTMGHIKTSITKIPSWKEELENA